MKDLSRSLRFQMHLEISLFSMNLQAWKLRISLMMRKIVLQNWILI
jgi:hypothetical protein